MGITEILFIGIGLSMDAFAVSVSGGLTMRKIYAKNVIKIALCFGLFQAIMPTIGWLAASSFEKYIRIYDGWIALILLGYIGVKMIYESIKGEENTDKDISKLKILIPLGIATSIDALVVGVTFVSSYIGWAIIEPVSLIGMTTFLISAVGVTFGKKFGEMLGSRAEIAGGIILIAIGIKIFLS